MVIKKQDNGAPALVSVDDAARFLACSPKTIRNLISTQQLGSVRLGRLLRIRQRDLDAIVDRGITAVPPLRPDRRRARGGK